MSGLQLVIPGLPADLTRAAERTSKRQQREAERCACWSGHDDDPCFCECHPGGVRDTNPARAREAEGVVWLEIVGVKWP